MTDRELVIRALRRLADEARRGQDPDAHPTVEDLVAYHADELSEGRDREIQEHLLLCAECPELILALDGFAEVPEGAATLPPSRMDSAWEEIRQRLVQEGELAERERPSPWSWRSLFSLPRPLLVTAAILLAVAAGLLLLRPGPSGEPQPRIVAQLPAGLPSHELDPAVRGPGRELEIAVPRSSGFALIFPPEGRFTSAEYRVELALQGTGGRTLWSGPWRPGSPTDSLLLVLPPGFLPPGDYRLVLRPVVGGRPGPKTEAERNFRLSFS